MLGIRPYGCVLALSICFFLIIADAQLTHPSEVSALLAVRSRLFDRMKRLHDWNHGDPCASNWTGVICGAEMDEEGYLHVQEIQLLNMNLSGSLAPELGQFCHLSILDFMWNDLTGSIPKEIGNITSLKLLLLNGNKLSGSLPDELGYLPNLNRLQIDQNQISGPIPKSFSNLHNIRHLHLNNNSLSGQIPSDLSNCSTLLHLLLDNNNFSGYLPPEFSNFPEMRILQFDNNQFVGAEIPAAYGNLSKLVKLSLRNCSLRGPVPDLSSISTLGYLDLSLNQLTGAIPSNKLSPYMTTIDLSENQLNGSIPESLSYLPFLQTLCLENNLLSGSIPATIWQNKSFNATTRLLLDFGNNLLSNVTGDLSPPQNTTLRLQGNPICGNANIQNIDQYCKPEAGGDDNPDISKNSTMICPIPACPTDNYYEYVPGSPVPCFCASPLRVGYRLKSPSFSFFPPYEQPFEMYLTSSLKLELYQLSIDSIVWEKGPRLRMYLKLFPKAGVEHSNTFNLSEILRIRGIFTTWVFPGNDLYGPYELLNFTLIGPYSYVNIKTQDKGISKKILIASLVAAVACTVTITSILTLVLKRRHVRYLHELSRKRTLSKLSINISDVKNFTFKEMAMATGNFSSSYLVGQGGYGKVYKGILSDKTVAIKRAEESSLQGEKEFLTEIELLSRLHHRNLVTLVGYCDEEQEQMLVYEFMPNGTLRNWLSAKSVNILSFKRRLNIALGSARGILYLHTEANPPIFHRDIKSSNILLDSNLTAKVADFGLSRLVPFLDDHGTVPNYISTVVRGTPGYLDPEYLLTYQLTDKSDVYSLGIVFLEILTGMHPISHGKNIVREVNTAHRSGTVFSIIDSRMGSYPSECIEKFVSLALKCTQDKPERRPPMLEVVRELENIQKMMPDTELESSESRSRYFGESSSSSSSRYTSRERYNSSDVLGSDLRSGTIPTITPR